MIAMGPRVISLASSVLTLPSPSWSSSTANWPVSLSPKTLALMLVASSSLMTDANKYDVSREAVTWSALVPHLMTGSVYLKSPAMTITTYPKRCSLCRMTCNVHSSASKACLCDVVHSSRMMRWHFFNSWPALLALVMLQLGEPLWARSRGSLKVARARY